LGTGRRGAALDAALVNGAAAHALDFDDCSTTMGGHPSAPVVPAVLALAEEIGASGSDLIISYVAGVETETRLARALLPHHYDKGWHPTATLGVFGAAAACSRLLGLDNEAMARALAIAASLACGVKANFGTPTKPLHVGVAARNGLMAARLAERGLSASPVAFEQVQGFFEVFNGAGNYDAEAALTGWEGPLELLSPGIAIKQHPCCGSAQPAIDAAIKLHARHGPFRLDDVREIRSSTHFRRLPHTDRPDPRTDLDAKFSVQYLVARSMLERRILLGHFEGTAIMDPQVRALTARVVASSHDDSDEYLGHVTIAMHDGTELHASAVTPLGRGPENPMTIDELKVKFMDCAVRTLPEPAAEKLFDAILKLDRLESVASVTALMMNAGTGSEQEQANGMAAR
jgi:2-methylcitrate dehydratase PrpD